MTKLGVSKKIIITLLSIMLSVLALFSVLTVIYKQKLIQQKSSATSSYIFMSTNYNLMAEDYNAYTDFHINSTVGLSAFSEAVSDGYTFSGKNVYLDCDLDWKNAYKDLVNLYDEILNIISREYAPDSPEYKVYYETYTKARDDAQTRYNNGEVPNWQPIGGPSINGTTCEYGTSYTEFSLRTPSTGLIAPA